MEEIEKALQEDDTGVDGNGEEGPEIGDEFGRTEAGTAWDGGEGPGEGEEKEFNNEGTALTELKVKTHSMLPEESYQQILDDDAARQLMHVNQSYDRYYEQLLANVNHPR